MEKKIILSDLINMAEFVLKNNYFEFDSKVKKHISGSAIRTKLGPPYTFIFMDKVEREFPEAEDIKTMVMGEVYRRNLFIWTKSENKLERPWQRLNTFHPNLKFTCKKSKTSVIFSDIFVRINVGKFKTDIYSKPTDFHQFLVFDSVHPIHLKNQLFIVKGYVLKIMFVVLGICKTPWWLRTSMVYKFFDKKSPGRGIKSMPNQQLTNEFHKRIIRKFKERGVSSLFKDNIWVLI